MEFSNQRLRRSGPANIFILFFSVAMLVSWLLPNHYFPWTSFYNDFAAWSGLAILLAYVVLFAPAPITLPRWIIFPAVVSVIPIAQALAGQVAFAGDAWISSAYVAGFTLACACGFALGGHHRLPLFEAHAWAFLWAASLSVCIQLYQWLGLQGMGIWIVDIRDPSRAYGNLAQPNNLATLLCIGLAADVYLHAKERISRPSAIFLATLLLFGIVITQSRTSWVSLSFLVIWWCYGRRFVPRLSAWAVAGGALFYLSLVLSLPQITDALQIAAGARENASEVGVRSVIWTQLLHAVSNAPLWGYGWGQVAAAQISVAADYAPSILVEHSHNIIIDLLIWNGIPLGIVIVASVGFWLVSRAIHCRSSESWFGLVAIGFVVIHGLLELPLEYAYFLVPVGIMVGLVEADQHAGVGFRCPKGVAMAIWIGGIVLMSLYWREYRLIEADHRLMRFETAGIGRIQATQPAPDVVLLSQLREFLRYARTPAHENMDGSELAWMRSVAHRYPYPPSLFRYAFALAISGREGEAAHELAVLRQLHGEQHYAEAKAALRASSDRYPAIRQMDLP